MSRATIEWGHRRQSFTLLPSVRMCPVSTEPLQHAPGDGPTEGIPQEFRDEEELDDARELLEAGDVRAALDELIPALKERRDFTSDQEWAGYGFVCRKHPICQLIHQDPFTARAFEKPRGYAGDAGILDMIYGPQDSSELQSVLDEASDLGRAIYDYTLKMPACAAVRARRAVVAAAIDRVAANTAEPQVMSIGSGYLREAELSQAVREKKLGRLVALDSDTESLGVVDRSYSDCGVEVVAASIRRLLDGDLKLGEFDFIYSAWLFDYLRQSTGQSLVARMYELLRPGGRLLVTNFVPDLRDVGYMEVFMDWELVYRTRQEMMELSRTIPPADVDGCEVRVISDDETQLNLLLEITKPG